MYQFLAVIIAIILCIIISVLWKKLINNYHIIVDGPKYRYYIIGILLFIGLGIFFTSAFYSMLSWIPERWGWSEEGDFVSMRLEISILISIFISGYIVFFMIPQLGEYEEMKRIQKEQEKEKK